MDTGDYYHRSSYGFSASSVPLPVQHHPALLSQHSFDSAHHSSLNGYQGHNPNMSHNLPPLRTDSSELHGKITVETPQPKQRRRRGTVAGNLRSSPEQPSTSTTPLKKNPNHGIVVKTKFPVARIKRIMQADEDVGKVAQVTPVIVSKALELFMISICTKACDQARSRNSKRITAAHLKQVVSREEQFDFLAEVVAKVPDIPLPQEGSGHNGDSGEDASPGSARKPRKPRTRKTKDEDF